MLARARGNLAQVMLDLAPRSARVLVDGVPTRPDARGGLVLEVGDHTVEVQASGYLGERRTRRIVGGEKLTLNVGAEQAQRFVYKCRLLHGVDDRPSVQRRGVQLQLKTERRSTTTSAKVSGDGEAAMRSSEVLAGRLAEPATS